MKIVLKCKDCGFKDELLQGLFPICPKCKGQRFEYVKEESNLD